MNKEVALFVDVKQPERTVRINITAREGQIAEIDRRARGVGLTRSSYVVQKALERKVASH